MFFPLYKLSYACSHTASTWFKVCTLEFSSKSIAVPLLIIDITNTFLPTGQKSHLKPLKSAFCLQWECVHSAFTPGSIDSAVDTGFYHLGSAQL